jgi:hypothetical protein
MRPLTAWLRIPQTLCIGLTSFPGQGFCNGHGLSEFFGREGLLAGQPSHVRWLPVARTARDTLNLSSRRLSIATEWKP